MLMMEVESDPLTLKDPLDCTEDVQSFIEETSDWIFQLKSEIVPAIISRDTVSNPDSVQESETKLRSRRCRKIKKPQRKDIIEFDWRPKAKPKRKALLVINEDKKKKVPDAENLIASEKVDKPMRNKQDAVTKRKIKKDYYLKKYQMMKEKRSFLCDLCHKTFITSTHLKEHIMSHCQYFPCNECDKVFNHLRSLQRHVAGGHDPKIRKIPVKRKEASKVDTPNERNNRGKKYYEQLKSERKYQCEICQKTFITSGHLNTHMYCHSEKKWNCEGCGKNFSCERSLTRHKDTFPGEHWFPCQFCDMTFFRATNIVKHMEIKHPEASIDAKCARELNLPLVVDQTSSCEIENGENEDSGKKIFVCSKCLKVFYSGDSLKIHKEAVHSSNSSEQEKPNALIISSQEPKFKCELCSKEFVSLEGFEYHKNNQHVDKETKKKKRKKSGLLNESADATEVKGNEPSPSFVCKICSAGFPIKSELQTHLKSHNVTKNMEVKTGSHQCCICPRSFASSDGLKYHLATHTGERRYSCGQCGKKFIKKTHLSEHIATHSEVKYFKCFRCPRTFSTHSAYRKHMKHFPGPHSFPCSKCGKLFTKESMIEKHMCVDLVKITMAPEVKALLSEDMIEEYLCLAEEQAAEELARRTERSAGNKEEEQDQNDGSKSSDQSNYHSCYKCFKVFPSLSSLQSHQLDHIGKQNYQCRFCPENFKRADAFGAHIRNHLGSTPYMCLKCNRKFISPLTLSMHAKNYPEDHSFTCQKCQRWFPSEKRVERHECILQNSDEFICACSSVFKSWNELLNHAGAKPYKCCSCDLKYPTLIALARHIKKHTGIKPFTCEICGKSFRAKNNYLYHKNLHNEVKEICCEHCDFRSKSRKRMDFHLFRKHNIGSNANSTLCPFCGIMFPYLSHMKKHVELEHGNDLVLEELKEEKKSFSSVLCTLCGKLLNNKYTLANHMKKVHNPGTKQEKEWNCEVCGEKFKSSKRLQRHAEIHEPPGLRLCQICDKEFYFAKDLRKHMKRHDTNKPYSCARCGKNFKVSVSLKYHSSICGNFHRKVAASKKKKEERSSSFQDHVEPLDLNNRSDAVG